MRRRACFLRGGVGLAAVPARSQWCRRLTVLFFAGLLAATASAADPKKKPPKPVPETIGSMGVIPIGLAVPIDALAFRQFDASTLKEIVEEIELWANDALIRSNVNAMLVLTAWPKTNVVNAANREVAWKIALAARESKPLREVMSVSGADLALLLTSGLISGQAPTPNTRQAFKPDYGFAVDSVAGEREGQIHEIGHLFGLRHNPEAYPTPPSSSWPNVFGYCRPDGTGDIMSYCARPLLVLSGPDTGMGDALHNNAAMARLSAPWVAAYNTANRPRSLMRSCVENVEASCLSRFLVKVRWVARDPQASIPAGWARVLPGSNDTAASFEVSGGTVAKVSRTSRTVGGRVVTDFAIVSGPAPVSYRVTVTDPDTGYIYGWDVRAGQAANLKLPAVF